MSYYKNACIFLLFCLTYSIHDFLISSIHYRIEEVILYSSVCYLLINTVFYKKSSSLDIKFHLISVIKSSSYYFCLYIFIESCKLVHISGVYLVYFLYPVFLIVFVNIRTKQKKNDIKLVVIAFLGTFCVFYNHSIISSLLGILLAILSALLYSVFIYFSKELTKKYLQRDSNFFYAFYMTIISTIFAIPIENKTIILKNYHNFLFIGALGYCAQRMLFNILKQNDYSKFSILSYLSIIWVILFDKDIMSRSYTTLVIIGAIMIAYSNYKIYKKT